MLTFTKVTHYSSVTILNTQTLKNKNDEPFKIFMNKPKLRELGLDLLEVSRVSKSVLLIVPFLLTICYFF